jgi:hypothetical protein
MMKVVYKWKQYELIPLGRLEVRSYQVNDDDRVNEQMPCFEDLVTRRSVESEWQWSDEDRRMKTIDHDEVRQGLICKNVLESEKATRWRKLSPGSFNARSSVDWLFWGQAREGGMDTGLCDPICPRSEPLVWNRLDLRRGNKPKKQAEEKETNITLWVRQDLGAKNGVASLDDMP